MFASFCWVSCIAPIGLPNARRVLLYSSADSKQARAAPIAPQPMPKRASLRQDSGPRIPVTPGRTALSGSRTEFEGQLRRHRRAQRQLVVHVRRGEAAHPALDEEAANARVGRAPTQRRCRPSSRW